MAWISIKHSPLDISVPFYILTGVFFFVLLVSTFTDIDWKIIPDEASYFLIGAALIFSPWNPLITADGGGWAFFSSLRSGILAALPLWIIAVIGKKIIGKEAMGGGDIKLMFGFGCFFGWQSGIQILFFGALLGSIFIGIGLICGLTSWKKYIPFGPFLNLAASIEYFFRTNGSSILELFLSRSWHLCDFLKKIP